jgi:predicted nucleic acid-binding protein
VIHLDTNALIALPVWLREEHAVVRRVLEGEPCEVCAVVWYEFLIGPVGEEEIRLAHAFIRGDIVSVGTGDAGLAARLFNTAGRRRTLKTDALIAACAIRAGADFLTLNYDDFGPFASDGLSLIEPPSL